MPFIFIFIGLIILVSAVQNTWRSTYQLTDEVVFGDEGETGFIWWLLSIFIVGAIGFAGNKQGGGVRTLSRLSIALIIVSMVLSNSREQNIFEKFISEVKRGMKPELTTIGAPLPESSGGDDDGGGFNLSDAANLAANFI